MIDFRRAFALFIGPPEAHVQDLAGLLSEEGRPVTFHTAGGDLEVLYDWVTTTSPEALATKVAAALGRAQAGEQQVICVCMPMSEAGRKGHDALAYVTRLYQPASFELLSSLAHIFLVAPSGDQPPYEEFAEKDDMWESGSVVTMTRASILEGLRRALSEVEEENVTPSPLPAELESLLSESSLLLSPSVGGDLLSVLREQVVAAAADLASGLPWTDDMAETLLQRLAEGVNGVRKTPLTEEEARHALKMLSEHMPIDLSLSSWSRGPEAPLRAEEVPGAAVIGCQPLRWLSYLPNGFYGNRKARMLLMYLHVHLTSPMYAAIRLNALRIHSAEDLYAYCRENGIVDDAATLSFFVSSIGANGEDQQQLAVFCGELVVEGYRASAVANPCAPDASGDSATDGEVEGEAGAGAASISAQRWCEDCVGVINAMARPLVQRKAECTLLLLGLLSRANVFIHGPPGVAKSMLARRLFPFFATDASGQAFKIVLSKTTLPDEVFGPVSITAAKDDRFERSTQGYLPEAPLAFVDEVFNASSAILNGLLSIVNERVFRNGNREVVVPLEMVVAASTDYPTTVLAPFYDRFLIRVDIKRLATGEQWEEMLRRRWEDPMAREAPAVPAHQLLNKRILAEIQNRSRSVIPSARVLHFLRELPGKVLASGKHLKHHVDISERRLGMAQDTLQTAAVVRKLAVGGKEPQINLLDLALIQHMLWAKPADHAVLSRAFRTALDSCLEAYPIESEVAHFQTIWKQTPWKAAIDCPGPVGYLGGIILAAVRIS